MSELRRWWEGSPRRWPASTLWTLFWLSMLFFQPIFDDRDRPLQWAVAATVVVLFVPFYLAVELRDGPARRWAAPVTTLLAVAAVPFNSGASVLLVYAAGFAGSFLSRRSAVRWLAGLTALLGAIALVSSIPFPYRIMAFAPSLALIWVIGLLTVEGVDAEREARFHRARVEYAATLSERERIARDLHDLLGQTLTGIVVRSQLAQRLARGDVDAGVAEMAEVEQAARAALTEVRATVSGWRFVEFDDEVAVARDALRAAGVELVVVRDAAVTLVPTAETALALALREAVTNVVRHSRARRCTVTLRHVAGADGGQVELEVVDDGVGGSATDGNGLTGMRERVAQLGGELRRRGTGGTSLTVELPAVVAR
ncbi:sensor histidine kinase [Pseudonocardia hydrocarbonoxydans]|uniref:Histidine kinase n=1 Tax=Pseudonocardia hydrocarbonoxydans TaxID=76726 RepID=A0A4Y3WUK6_9PSEU|nr:sensor histidine kinase [Pseudonocardia hydrocarbonoxydans]GEC22513.1 histidine kinase [Pseudonocardia hydrocarbonoxydans]